MHLLRQTEIGDFDFTTVISRAQKNIARLQIVMYLARRKIEQVWAYERSNTHHRRFDFQIEILQGVDRLHNDRSCFFFRNGFILFKKKVQIITITVFQYCAKGIRVDFEHVE
jgi:hypothetical protein